MSTFLISLSMGLHVLATIVFVGYYFFTGMIYLPVFERQMQPNAMREMLECISTRLRPYFGSSLLIFLVTGTYLMLINKSYLGLGHFFSNPWSALIVIKHGVVLVFLAVAVFSERAFLPQINDKRPEALQNFKFAMNVNTILGIIIVLMTSIAQVG
jgi:uncharacterized membrane protein